MRAFPLYPLLEIAIQTKIHNRRLKSFVPIGKSTLRSFKYKLNTTKVNLHYGLNKIMYKHEMPKDEATQIPNYLKNNKPIEVSPRGQNVYIIQTPTGELKLITSPTPNGTTVSSMYYPK